MSVEARGAERKVDRDGNAFVLRPIACPTCGPGPERRLGVRGGPTQRWGLGVETTIVQCVGCGLLYPNPFPFPENAARLYGDPEKYFTGHPLPEKIARYRCLAREIAARSGLRSPRILDVGAGRGDFVHAAALEGMHEVVGLEHSEAMREFARRQFGVELVLEPAERLAQREPGRFDAVVLNAVLEHVHDPDALVASVARLLRDRGILFIDVPNEPNLVTAVGNAFKRLGGADDVYNLQPTWPPFHVFGFNRRALGALLAKHGLRVDRVDVRGSVKVRAGRSIKDRAAALAAEQVQRLANLTGTAHNMTVWAHKGLADPEARGGAR